MTGVQQVAESRSGAILTIDLDAIVQNWALLKSRFAGAECGAVLKADAYGLGADRVAPALFAAGCRKFFVAHIEEALRLRGILPQAEIHVLHGPNPGTEGDFLAHDLIPMLNSPEQLRQWRKLCADRGPLPAMLHVDTGMARLGLSEDELAALGKDDLQGVRWTAIASHLACADMPEHELTALQLARFQAAKARIEALIGHALPGSLCNSSGIFLGPDWHFDVARPGVGLFGAAPQAGRPNPLAQVVTLQGKILQIREIDSPNTVGYGAAYRLTRKSRIATVAIGYADGLLRCLGNRSSGRLGGISVPLVGRVSMDLITFDVTDAPAHLCRPGQLIDLIGPDHDLDAIAAEAGTIGYEILTSLGSRYHRVYRGAGA